MFHEARSSFKLSLKYKCTIVKNCEGRWSNGGVSGEEWRDEFSSFSSQKKKKKKVPFVRRYWSDPGYYSTKFANQDFFLRFFLRFAFRVFAIFFVAEDTTPDHPRYAFATMIRILPNSLY